ncbi:DUF6161 domain-containing protein [Roseovarius sp.]|uniref:DUF6161 domain-containing protein n=1 Tax=Roseovarius sp. TaxID=1486281 RepID=UPI003A9758CC
MANEEYRLYYKKIEDVVFPSKNGMKRYLTKENQIWTPFLDYMRNSLRSGIATEQGRGNSTAEQLAIAFESQKKRLDDRAAFNRATQQYVNNSILPPPSDSLEGHLILGLFDSGMAAEALAAYVYCIAKEANARYNTNDEIGTLVHKGKPLVDAAPIVKALPYSRVSTSKMAGAVRTAENHAQSLADEIVAAQKANAAHDFELQTQLDKQKKQAKRVDDVIRRLNRRRDSRHKLWVKATEQLVEEKFEEARKKVRLFEVKSQRAEKARVAEFERLQSLFETQLRLRAPVKLWETREINHGENSKNAMSKFICAGVIAVGFGLLVPFFFGDYIANSFSQLICTTPATTGAIAQGCERAFSAKGPVTVTGLLLVMSLLMWMARLQYRIHLSERHLALDASEKKAFAETYLAMKEGEDVSRDNEAIVLASLFRPTQDGIIRDDESGMDLSAVTMMAKQFSRNS